MIFSTLCKEVSSNLQVTETIILPNVDDVDDVHWRKRENKLVKTEYEDENDNVYESEEDRLKRIRELEMEFERLKTIKLSKTIIFKSLIDFYLCWLVNHFVGQ